MTVMKVVMTMAYQNCSSDQPPIYLVSSAAETSFNSADFQESTTPTLSNDLEMKTSGVATLLSSLQMN